MFTCRNYSRKESQKKDEGESNPVRTTNSENTEQSQLGNEWKMFTICRVEKISHNVKRFRFELPVDSTLGLRCGDHCRLRYMYEAIWLTQFLCLLRIPLIFVLSLQKQRGKGGVEDVHALQPR